MKQIITKGILVLLMVLSCSMQAQKKTVVGTVADKDGIPLVGASIVIKGTATGVSTDFDGKYSITANENDILVISYVGYTIQEVTINEKITIDITLLENANALDEVIVVGYGTEKKSNLVGSISKVNSKDLIKVSVANATELISGRAPGVITKQTSSVPGNDNTSFQIRGFGAPLVLVDGIQTSFARVNPNDIESISFLKDASAAVYGVRAGNGVVLVTTKRGKTGKPVISLSTVTSFQQPTVWRDNVNGAQFTEMQNEGGAASYTPQELELYRQGAPGYESYNWEREVFRTWAPMTQQDLSIRGGSENIKFFASLGYLGQGGQFKSGDLNYNRKNLRANIDGNISKKLSFGLNIDYKNELASQPRGMGLVYSALTVSEPILSPHIPGHPDLAANSGGGFANRSATGAIRKDLAGFRDNNHEELIGKLKLDYEIVKGLTAEASFMFKTRHRYIKSLEKPISVYQWDRNQQEPVLSGTQGRSSIYESYFREQQLITTLALRYEQAFNDHNVKILLLNENNQAENANFNAYRQNLLSDELPYLDFGDIDTAENAGNANNSGLSSAVGRVNYDYKNKYFLEGTFRYDGTYRFRPGNRWGFFPSFLGAWKISEEGFIKNNFAFIDNLKLRVSYSETGRDNIGTYRDQSFYDLLTGHFDPYLFGESGLTAPIRTNGIPNPNATWENYTLYNAGIDARFLKGLIGFEFDIFYRLREGIFATPLDQFPSTFGANLPQLNQNAVDHRGFDFLITHRNKIGEFKYDIGVNFGISRAKWVTRPNDKNIEAFASSPEELIDPEFIRRFNLIQKHEGNWVNRNIGYVSDGIFMNQAEIDAHTVDQSELAGGTGNANLVPGDIKYVDLNGDGKLDWRDQTEIGKGDFPDMSYGMNLNASYKNFSLSVLLQGAAGFNFNITGGARNIFQGNIIPFKYQYKHRWTPDPNSPGENINPNAILPASTDSGVHANNNQTSDFWLQDGTYLRLKSLNLGYDLPSSILEKIGFKSFRIYAAGSNLFTWNKLGIYKGTFDSEGPKNQSGGSYPLVKTVSFGVNLSI